MNILVVILRLVLLPFTILYYFIIVARNLIYDFSIIDQTKFQTPIISVGNITTGGTGKTPLVIYLTDYFIEKGKKVGVISRGYKSNTKNLVIAFDGTEIKSTVNYTGDELGMIINRFLDFHNKFFAIAYHNRVKAIKKMEELFSPDIIILDDAFQNRKIIKTIDILLINSEKKTFFDRILLPSGNLREPLSSLKRADIIFNNYKFKEISDKNSISINYFNTGYFNIFNNPLNISDEIKAIAISGIADNNSFLNAIKISKIDIIKSFCFQDHYGYNQSDVRKFVSEYTEGIVFITTEKDFIKLREFKDFAEKYPVYYLRIDVNLNNQIIEELFRKKNLQW